MLGAAGSTKGNLPVPGTILWVDTIVFHIPAFMATYWSVDTRLFATVTPIEIALRSVINTLVAVAIADPIEMVYIAAAEINSA